MMTIVLVFWLKLLHRSLKISNGKLQLIRRRSHIEEFAENTISFWRPNTDRQYYISDVVSHIWQSWDEYYKYVNSLNIQSVKLNEYKKFLEEFKKADFKNTVYFDFKEMHFDL